MIDGDNFGIIVYFQASIVDNFGILAYIQALIVDNFGISAHIQALIADDFSIFNTLELQTSGIINPHFTNCTNNSLRMLYIKRDTTRNTGDM